MEQSFDKKLIIIVGFFVVTSTPFLKYTWNPFSRWSIIKTLQFCSKIFWSTYQALPLIRNQHSLSKNLCTKLPLQLLVATRRTITRWDGNLELQPFCLLKSAIFLAKCNFRHFRSRSWSPYTDPRGGYWLLDFSSFHEAARKQIYSDRYSQVPSVFPIKRTNHMDLRVSKTINQSEPEGEILTLASTWKWDSSPR